MSSCQESIVLLCPLLFHVDSPLDVSAPQLVETTGYFFESSTWKSGIIRPHIEADDFNSPMFLGESISLIHTIASVGKT